MVPRGTHGAALPVLVAICTVISALAEVRITYRRIVDTETLAPGSDYSFHSFAPPSLVDGLIGFWAQVDTAEPGLFDEGIYLLREDKLLLVANRSTPMPGAPPGVGNFVEFTTPSLGAGGGTFSGFGLYDWQGIYSFDEKLELSIVADRNTADPAGPSNLGHFFLCSRSGEAVAFSAFPIYNPHIPWNHGIYTTAPGELTLVANYTTRIPGGSGMFTRFDFNVTIGNGVVAFAGGDDHEQYGVYADPDGLVAIADRTTPIPGGSGTFTHFDDRPLSDGGCVAFHGLQIEQRPYRVVQEGVYVNVGGHLRVVADLNTPIPGGIGNFTGFGYGGRGFALVDRRVVCRGNGADGQQGIYGEFSGRLVKVVDLSTNLEPDKTLSHVNTEPQCLDGNNVGFAASFPLSPGQFYRAIYVATLWIPGDLSCNGQVDFGDVNPFVLALTNPAGYALAYPDCDIMLADCNGDGVVNAFDIDPFVALLVGP